MLKKHERLCSKSDYCHVKMSKEDNKIFDKHAEKLLETPFKIIADLECILLKKVHVRIILKNLTKK